MPIAKHTLLMVVITIFHSSLHIVTFSDGPMVYIHDNQLMCSRMILERRTLSIYIDFYKATIWLH